MKRGQVIVWLDPKVDGYPPKGVAVLCADATGCFYVTHRNSLSRGEAFWNDYDSGDFAIGVTDEDVIFYAYIPKPEKIL